MRAAAAGHDAAGRKVARFGDNMREVAVTEGDKVAAQMPLRLLGQRLRRRRPGRGDRRGDATRRSTRSSREYDDAVHDGRSAAARRQQRESLRDAARIELGMRALPRERRLQGLHHHLRGSARPGAAARARRAAADGRRLRLRRRGRLEDGRAGARDEGDGERACRAARPSWRTTPTTSTRRARRCWARTCSRSAPRSPRASPRSRSIRWASAARPTRRGWCSTRPPARRSTPRSIDLGNRFRLIVNEVDVVKPDAPLPKLPVARAVWVPQPDLKIAAAAWIYAGGAHHTGFSQALTSRAPRGLRRDGRHRVRADRRDDHDSASSRRSCAGTRRTTCRPRACSRGADGDPRLHHRRHVRQDLRRDLGPAALPRHAHPRDAAARPLPARASPCAR